MYYIEETLYNHTIGQHVLEPFAEKNRCRNSIVPNMSEKHTDMKNVRNDILEQKL